MIMEYRNIMSNKEKVSVSVVLTSCERLDLLSETLDSFLEMNTYPIDEFIIIEDSNKEKELQKLLEDKPSYFRYICNGKRLGQLNSIDKAYATVKSDYVFHMEDDWIFLEKGFIEKSVKVLVEHPQYLSLWLRNKEEVERLIDENKKVTIENKSYYHIEEEPLSFSPSLIKLENYKKVAPYSSYERPIEQTISAAYSKLGFTSLLTDYQIVDHIGWHRRTMNPEEKQRLAIQYKFDKHVRKYKAQVYKFLGIGKFKNK